MSLNLKRGGKSPSLLALRISSIKVVMKYVLFQLLNRLEQL